MGRLKNNLPESVDSALDDLLANWAEAAQLSEARSGIILSLAVADSVESREALNYEWWRRVFATRSAPMPLLKLLCISPRWQDCQTRIIWAG